MSFTTLARNTFRLSSIKSQYGNHSYFYLLQEYVCHSTFDRETLMLSTSLTKVTLMLQFCKTKSYDILNSTLEDERTLLDAKAFILSETRYTHRQIFFFR